MPATETAAQPRNELVSSRVTEEEKRKIRRLAEIREATESALLREKGVVELVAEYDRTIQMARAEE